MASNPVTEPRSKHIDIRYHRIRESVAKGKVELFFIDGAENPADLLTKNLPREKFVKFMSKLDKGQYVPKLSHCQCEAKTTNIFT